MRSPSKIAIENFVPPISIAKVCCTSQHTMDWKDPFGMNYRQLGKSGLRVSELSLGAMTFGSRFFNIATVDQAGANAMVARALEAGVNCFDTADVYSFGESEETLGRALKECGVARESVVLATK